MTSRIGQRPKVSVLMPTRNRERFAARAVEQFLRQTWPNKELIVLEDGDESWMPHIGDNPLIHHVNMVGSIGAKLNMGAELATGEILIRFDDDDWQHPHRITQQIAHLRLSGTAMVGCCSQLYYRPGEDCAYEWRGNPANTPGLNHAYLRAWALDNPHIDASSGEDAALCKVAASQGELSTISGVGWVVARTHDSNTSDRLGGFRSTAELAKFSTNWKAVPLSNITAVVGQEVQYGAIA